MIKRNKKVTINFHGEENNMTYAEREITMLVLCKYFHAKFAEVDIPT